MVRYSLCILVCILFSSCGKDEVNVIEPHSFIGSWEIDLVTKDGSLIEGWEDVQLDFQEDSDRRNSGTYFINSPYDSIWKNKGSWRLHDSFTNEDHQMGSYIAIRDSFETVYISLVDKEISSQKKPSSQMRIRMNLSHTVTEQEWFSLCKVDTTRGDTTCAIIDLGVWSFSFKSVEL